MPNMMALRRLSSPAILVLLLGADSGDPSPSAGRVASAIGEMSSLWGGDSVHAHIISFWPGRLLSDVVNATEGELDMDETQRSDLDEVPDDQKHEFAMLHANEQAPHPAPDATTAGPLATKVFKVRQSTKSAKPQWTLAHYILAGITIPAIIFTAVLMFRGMWHQEEQLTQWQEEEDSEAVWPQVLGSRNRRHLVSSRSKLEDDDEHRDLLHIGGPS